MKRNRLILTIAAILFIGVPSAHELAAKNAPKVTKAQAVKALKARLPNGKILSSEFETEDGQQIWSFDVRDGAEMKEVWVSSTTGEVTKVETETKAMEAKEKKMDKAEVIAKRSVKGKVISSTSEGAGKDEVYVFQIKKKDGSTSTVRVSAATYKILK